MDKTQFMAAGISLLMLATLATPFTAADAANDVLILAQGEYSCGGDVDDGSASCTFSCRKNDRVTVEVTANDQDEWTPANAYGSATCGGAYANCNEPKKCSDKDEADEDATDGDCEGGTDEFWHDGFYYKCESIRIKGGEDITDPNLICDIVAYLCDSSDLTAWVDARVVELQEESSRCGIAWEAAVAPDPEWVQRQLVKVQGGAEGCAGLVAANADPVTGLPANVRSQVKVSVKGDQALGRVCNAGVGCHYVLPACETNEAGLIRGCTVNGASLRVEPSENLKALLGF